jgi:hypothetical protein
MPMIPLAKHPKSARIQMKRTTELLALLLIFDLALSPYASAELLKGSIQYNETFPVIGPILSPGAKFDRNEADRLFPVGEQDEWFRIPSAFAGTWKTKDSGRLTFLKDERSGHTETKTVAARPMRCSLGTQIDSYGEIWHLQNFPGLSILDDAGRNHSQTISMQTREITVQRMHTVVQPKELLLYLCFLVTPSGREYNSAATAYQEIQIESYVLTSPTVMQCTVVNRRFNSSGQPTRFEHTVRDYIKVDSFKSDPEDRDSFITYLKSKNLERFIPDVRFRSNTISR